MQGSASEHTWGRYERQDARIRVERARRDQAVSSRCSERQPLEHGQTISTVQRNGNIASHFKTNDEGSAQNRKHCDILEGSCASKSPSKNEKFEALNTALTVYTDSDWAGCGSSRKSTSGGVLSVNIRVVKHWSSTQRLVAVSSCEGELSAMNKAAAEATGIRSLARRHWTHVRHLFQNRRRCGSESCQQAWRRKDAPHCHAGAAAAECNNDIGK